MTEIKNKELLDKDLYKLFEIEDETCTIEQIKKAYRKRALELHPDKNLGNKEEAEKNFVELGKAFEILADKNARSAYDAVRRARREKAKRDELLDDKRRKLKEQLESREQAARDKAARQTNEMRKNKEEENLSKEIERLRKEGSKLLEEEMNFVNEQIRMENKRHQAPNKNVLKEEKTTFTSSQTSPRIKISWTIKAEGNQKKLDEDLLRYLFSKYGEIDVLVVSKKSTAILEFKRSEDAYTCLKDEKTLNEMYTITLKCLNDSKKMPDSSKSDLKTELDNSKKSNGNSNNDDSSLYETASFEDMEMAILKKLKSASN
jgi:DnaJ family protein C protein 17